MVELRMQFLAMSRVQSFQFDERARYPRAIRILYSNVQANKRVFDFSFWHFEIR